jgi:hypothetical protein
MKGDYEINRRWSDQHTPEIARILEGVMRQRMSIIITPADFRVDTKQATDLVSGVIGPKAFAARLRRPGVFWGRNFGSPTNWGLQFTIRSQLDSGTETELSKIKKGFADWFLYGHIEEGT